MTIGPEDWEAQEPSPDFVDRVTERVHGEERAGIALPEPRRRVSLRAGVAGGLALAAAVALAVGWRGHGVPDCGDAIAVVRTEVHLGTRAIAVLEAGAHVSWTGDDVSQPTGDVFYRVESGGSFHVQTPAGDVEVLGTCFRVRVEKSEGQMTGRDLKAGAVGAALSAALFVSVYEGKVAIVHASQRVALLAGDTARVSGGSITSTHGSGSGDEEANGGAAETADPLVAANESLADSVREYKRRLEAIESQKATLDKRLADAQHKLALAENDGQAAPQKSLYDLSPDDWKEMAKEGRVVSRMPCASPAAWMPTPEQLAKDGLAPTDAQAIHDTRAQSYGRVWARDPPAVHPGPPGGREGRRQAGPDDVFVPRRRRR